MKAFLTAALVAGFAAACCADIQDPPSNDYGPTRKLGRGLSNMVFGWSEIPVTITTINTREGNSAAAGYGEVLLWPFPVNRGTYLPILPSDIPWIHPRLPGIPARAGQRIKIPVRAGLLKKNA
jgi:hypothetical protein